MNGRKILRLSLVLVLYGISHPGRAREFPGLSTRGPSGLVLVPTGQVIRGNNYAFGLHRGEVKGVYGVLNLAEVGVATPDIYEQPNEHHWKGQTTAFVKVGYDFSPATWWVPGMAMGAENSVWNVVVPKQREFPGGLRTAETYYGTGTWDWRIWSWPVEVTAVGGTGRYARRAFGALGIIPTTFFGTTLKAYVEYAGRAADFGVRIALARNLRLDFAMGMNADLVRRPDGSRDWAITLDRGVIGASQTGAIRLDAIFPGKKPVRR